MSWSALCLSQYSLPETPRHSEHRWPNRLVIVRAVRANCIEVVQAAASHPQVSPQTLIDFLGNPRRFVTSRLLNEVAQPLPKSSSEQKGRYVIRVMLGDCGEWKLWGRHPLTIN
jgi:hypothetical protein